jgi:hypothetical protein
MGDFRFMKDIFGREIFVGQLVAYAISFGNKHFEIAIVTETGEEHIKIKYRGINSYKSKWGASNSRIKIIGKESRITVTHERIIILNEGQPIEGIDIVQEHQKLFENEMQKRDKKISTYMKEVEELEKKVKKLEENNKVLQEEVDKVHGRWQILDI